MQSVAALLQLVSVLFCLVRLSELVLGQETVLSATPRTVPLINRSPYFDAWTSAPEGGDHHPSPAGAAVTSWSGRNLSWNGFIRVDGEVYQWMGNETSFTAAKTRHMYVTATRTVYTMEVGEFGELGFNVTFLSPVEAKDLVKFSMPFAYVYLDVFSKDGAHSVELYCEAGAHFVTRRNDTMEWDTIQTPGTVYHELHARTIIPSEQSDVAEHGTLYIGMRNSPEATHQSGPPAQTRARFSETGTLANTKDERSSRLTALAEDFPVFALSVNLGTVQTESPRIVFTIGHVRRELVSANLGVVLNFERRTSYFWSQYSTIGEVIDAFLGEFSGALVRAEELETTIMREAGAVSTEYSDLVALSLRQTMAAVEITLPQLGVLDEAGWNTSDVQAFMRDTGVSARGNPVETMYAAMPALLYLNPTILQMLLKPLFKFQASDEYRNVYASYDLGSTYTWAMGNNSNTESLAVESCSSMLIIAYISARQTNDFSLLHRYSSLLGEWAEYLVENSYNMKKDQITADGIPAANHSNLSLKTILGIHAMSRIQAILSPHGISSDSAVYYRNQSTTLARRWEEQAFVGGHMTSVFNQPATWAMMYNYYPVTLFAPALFSRELFQEHAKFLVLQLDASLAAEILPLTYDSLDSQISKSHWTMLTAATVDDRDIRDRLIDTIHHRTFWRGTTEPFATTWNVNTGTAIERGGRASPAQGAMFALLASEVFNDSTSGESGPTDPTTSPKPNIAAIAGGVVGGVASILLIAGAYVLYRRRKNAERLGSGNDSPVESISADGPITVALAPQQLLITPFECPIAHPSPLQIPPPSKEKFMHQQSQDSESRTDAAPANGPALYPSPPTSAAGSEQRSVLGTALQGSSLVREVEQLRRQVDELRAQRGQETFRSIAPSDAPPTYIP
ncbi:hypothetical protein FA15DRAFT_753532 [Coprinopsis marcescibilis]|uniref:DUF1793-domain-containing protein n=1 Tax=Coprinopsis marcescibilis TaxID=230819 RepID=A0A5C3L6V2_COPMA|nr:hypothetical protein FA15DRAFT_753532 [Coprinopsis marcescibilis]